MKSLEEPVSSLTTPSLHQFRLKPVHLLVIYFVSQLVIVTRRPDAILNAQFYAEDGHVWYADAYNLGWWHALLHTWAGFFQTLPRLGAALALLVPLRDSPLTLNVLAIAIMALPVVLILSERSAIWGTLKHRCLLAGMYLAISNCQEINASITESQWVFSFCAFLVIVSSRPRSRIGWALDLAILTLCGLTGPFFVFLIPIAIYLLRPDRSAWRWSIVWALTLPAIAQGIGLLVTKSSSDPFDHRGAGIHVSGATPDLMARILGGHIYLGSLVGGNSLATVPGSSASFVCWSLTLAGTLFMVVSLCASPRPLRLLIFFAAGLLAAALVSPTVGVETGAPAWQTLARGQGIRYWFLPTLAVSWSIAFGLRSKFPVLKSASYCLLCIVAFGICRDWRHPAIPDQHFAEYAQGFETAPMGTRVRIPLNPTGWDLQLTKR